MDVSIWEQILSRVETKVNRHSFYTWFKPTSLVADGGQSITVRVPNPLFKDWLTKHYSVVLSEALSEVRRTGASLIFVAEGRAGPSSNRTGPSLTFTECTAGRRRAGIGGPEPSLHVRHVHRGSIQPICTRGLPGGGGGAVAFL